MKSFFLTLLLTATAFSAEFAGKWSGTAEMNRNGESRSTTALLIFKQDGDRITGTAGRDESEQHQLENVKVDGDKLTFEINDGDTIVKATLQAEGDIMKGEAKAQLDGQSMTVVFNLKRQN